MKSFRPSAKFLILATAILISSTAFGESSGHWTKKSQEIAGTWKIESGKIILTGLSTREAPDLKIFLSPLSVDELTNKNAATGAVFVAKLSSHKGDQSYALPPDIDLTAYKSIIIHCQQYTKPWGAAPL